MMQLRQLGTTDLQVSELGMGCQSLGGGLYHRDDAESIATLQKAVDAGVTFFDVSDHHSQGIAETILGQAFKSRRKDLLLTTKAGYCYTTLGSFSLKARYWIKPISGLLKPFKRSLHLARSSQGRYNFKPEYIAQCLERSLQRLQTDHIDLYQLYKPSVEKLDDPAFEDTLALLEKLKQQGKIRYYGIACQWVHEALHCLKLKGISTVQVAVNLIEPEATHNLIDAAKAKNIGVIARHPRAIGLLTNAGADIMGDTSYYDKHRQERAKRAEEFRFLIKPDRTLAQAAIRYTLDIPGLDTVIPRAVNRQELDENLGSLRLPPLSDEEMRRVRELQSSYSD